MPFYSKKYGQMTYSLEKFYEVKQNCRECEKDIVSMIHLTEREKNVIYYLAIGYKNEEIAKILNISVHTVKAHLESIYEKFEVTNRVQAAMKAAKMNFVELEELV